jgi:hypothetical protein
LTVGCGLLKEKRGIFDMTSADLELEVWKRVIRGVFGDVVYGTLETVVKRELSKQGEGK